MPRVWQRLIPSMSVDWTTRQFLTMGGGGPLVLQRRKLRNSGCTTGPRPRSEETAAGSVPIQARGQPFAQPPFPQPLARGIRAAAQVQELARGKCVVLRAPFRTQLLRLEGRAGVRSQAGSAGSAGPERQSGALGARAAALPAGWQAGSEAATSVGWPKLSGGSDAGLADP